MRKEFKTIYTLHLMEGLGLGAFVFPIKSAGDLQTVRQAGRMVAKGVYLIHNGGGVCGALEVRGLQTVDVDHQEFRRWGERCRAVRVQSGFPVQTEQGYVVLEVDDE